MPSFRRRAAHGVFTATVLTWATALTPAAQSDGAAPPPVPIEPGPGAAASDSCEIDLTHPGQMSDVLSNLLVRAELKPEAEVKAFLKGADATSATGGDLRTAAAHHFKIDEKRMAELVEFWRHINCRHAAVPGYAVPDAAIEQASARPSPLVPHSDFAANVTLHVVLHELGHAVIREFDLMVLGNEETMADAFATHMLTEHLPERALGAISARVASLMIEANDVPRDQWAVRGEHNNDARRAYQITALAIAADRSKFASVATIVGMSERDMDRAMDYGSDIHRAWRRTLAPLVMPAGMPSKEARFRADEATTVFVQTGEPCLRDEIESVLRRIDWHSQVTVEFVGGRGGAAWSRSTRTITVGSEYVERFIEQGARAESASGATPP